MTEQELIEIEQDMNSNNGSWIANEKVVQLIKEVRKLKEILNNTKNHCKKNCNKNNQ